MNLQEVRKAQQRIASAVVPTRLFEVPADKLPRKDIRLFLKLECEQRGGAFKARGARNFIAALLESGKPKGVVTYSSGNHGRALAEAAKAAGIPAIIVAPVTMDKSKAAAVESAGAILIKVGTTSEQRRSKAEEFVSHLGYVMVPPFDHEWIIAGQGTVALEILAEIPDLSGIWIPVGGGGLAAGVAVVIDGLSPQTTIYCVEPAGSASLHASLKLGRRVRLNETASMADGLLPLSVGEKNWEILSKISPQCVTLSEEQIGAAFRRLRLDLSIGCEPSSAVAAAPLLLSDEISTGATAVPGIHVAIISGGNISEERLQALLK